MALLFMTMWLGSLHPVSGEEPVTPHRILRESLETVAVQVQENTTMPSGPIHPVVAGDLPKEQMAMITRQWRQSWFDQGYEIFVQDNASMPTLQLLVEEYKITLRRRSGGFFSGTNAYSGTFELTGSVSIIDSVGQLIEMTPVEQSREFQVAEEVSAWREERILRSFPVEFAGILNRPEIRTILLSITSGVIIYLFYVLRG